MSAINDQRIGNQTKTRKRKLERDARGDFRPNIGWTIFDGQRKQPRFNLGSDEREAERRYQKIQELFESHEHEQNCLDPGPGFWNPKALAIARHIASGAADIRIAPPPTRDSGSILEYQQGIEHLQRQFPSVPLFPADPAVYQASKAANEQLVANRIAVLESELKRMGALISGDELPDQLISGTLHEALRASIAEIQRDGAKLDCGTLTPHNRKRINYNEKFLTTHDDIPLYLLSLDKCKELIGYWRNRPTTEKGGAAERSTAENHLKELDRFFTFLDLSETYKWSKPKGFDAISRKIPVFENERTLSAIQKETFSPEHLGVMLRVATERERLVLLVATNCSMGAAELGRVMLDDIYFDQPHPYAAKLAFKSTESDSFLRYFRPKTGVFGEWVLWPETVAAIRQGIAKAKAVRSQFLICRDTGAPLYNPASSNPQQGFANLWNKLRNRARKIDSTIPKLPFGSLRDALPDIVRRDFSDELASIALTHGCPSKADSLLDCYSNKPFGRLHTTLRELREKQFAIMFK